MQAPFGHDAIARLIPHAGAMCLLARVIAADAQMIRCEADNHADPDHPLRSAGRLPITAGIEYAAQAAALHGAIKPGGEPREGYLAVLSDVRWNVQQLDDAAGPLSIVCTLLNTMGSGSTYAFTLSDRDKRTLLTGEMIVATR